MSPLPKGSLPRRSDAEVVGALESTGSTTKAARLLGYTPAAIYSRSKKSEAVRAAIAALSSDHPGFHNMTGQHGTWTVIERAQNTADGNAQWTCSHVCGAVHVLDGPLLRRRPPKFCKNCRKDRS